MLCYTAAALSLLASSTHAFSSGAGGCMGGQAAVGGGHIRPDAEVSFADAGFEFTVNNVIVTPGTEVIDGFTYEIGVRATGDEFRGALIRADGMGVFAEGMNSQVAPICGDVAAVTHMNNTPKESLVGSFTVMGQGTIVMDVTVVVANSAESIYSYQQFELTSVPEGGGATDKDDKDDVTDMETAAPAMANGTSAPVAMATGAPMMAPGDTTGAPAMAPVTAPTKTTPTSAAILPAVSLVAVLAVVSALF